MEATDYESMIVPWYQAVFPFMWVCVVLRQGLSIFSLAGLELTILPASISQVAGITDMHRHAKCISKILICW
jgi:hypothetical protein